jgi:hypothetical protein
MMRIGFVLTLGLLGCAQSVGVKNENPDLSGAIDLAGFLNTSDGGLDFSIVNDLAGRDLNGVDLSVAQPSTDMAGCVHIDPLFSPGSGPANWQGQGSAYYDPNFERLDVTTDGTFQAGTIFYNIPQLVSSFHATFDVIIGSGTGGDGMAFVLMQSTSPGGFTPKANGGSLGFYGMDAWAVEFDTAQNFTAPQNDPSANYVALMRSTSASGAAVHVPGLYSPSVATPPNMPAPMLSNGGTPHTVDITFTGTSITCIVDNLQMFSGPLPAGYVFTPGQYYFGFTGATGNVDDVHAFNNVHIVTGGSGCN